VLKSVITTTPPHAFETKLTYVFQELILQSTFGLFVRKNRIN